MNTKHFRHGQCKKNFVKYVIEPSFKYTKNKFHLWETHFPQKKRSSNRQLQNFLKQRKSVVLYKRPKLKERKVKCS